MKLSILDAIDRYKEIHNEFCGGGSEATAQTQLDKLIEDCNSSGLVFAPKVSDLYEHAQFNTIPVVDEDESSEDEESSEY